MTMQMNRRNALAAFAAAAVPGAWAQDRYPSRPIRIIVTNAAGGASDMIARMIGTGLTAALGQPVAVEPMPAANGMCSKTRSRSSRRPWRSSRHRGTGRMRSSASRSRACPRGCAYKALREANRETGKHEQDG